MHHSRNLALGQVAGKWMEDQAQADTPFVPPDAAKEHCVYLMDAAAADAWLEKLGVKKVGKTGNLAARRFRNTHIPRYLIVLTYIPTCTKS